jgi:hypothetical protein
LVEFFFALFGAFAVSPDNRLIAVSRAGVAGSSQKNYSKGTRVQLLDASTGKTVRGPILRRDHRRRPISASLLQLR